LLSTPRNAICVNMSSRLYRSRHDANEAFAFCTDELLNGPIISIKISRNIAAFKDGKLSHEMLLLLLIRTVNASLKAAIMSNPFLMSTPDGMPFKFDF
jgi:hypothetical protein